MSNSNVPIRVDWSDKAMDTEIQGDILRYNTHTSVMISTNAQETKG